MSDSTPELGKFTSYRTKEEIAKDIKFILEDKVAPAVAQHGGFINYLDFDMD